MSKILYCSDVVIMHLYFNIRIDVPIATTDIHITQSSILFCSQAERQSQVARIEVSMKLILAKKKHLKN